MSSADAISLGQGQCTRATDKAVCVRLEADAAKELWIPQSCVHDDSEVWQSGQAGNVVVKRWWAEERGLA